MNQKIKRIIIVVIPIVVLVLFGWQQYIIYQTQNTNFILNRYLKDLSDAEFKGMSLSEDLYDIIQYQGERISDSIWIYNEQEDSVILNRCNPIPTFILCINQNGCDVCIDKCIEMINSLKEKLSEDNVMLIGRFTNPLYFYKYKRINKVHVPMYHFKTIGIKNEDSTTPFGFILEEGVIRKFFIFHKEFEDLNREYERIIERYLLKKRRNEEN
ncbi:MAG: hypothetical protein E7071_05480 [Bacteroidales bacterium]|nr:hypothetical protein [Bacteroidales bacterium]